MKAAVITCSTRSAHGERADLSGRIITDTLVDAGYTIAHRSVIVDNIEQIRDAINSALEAGARVVITTGGTGLSPTDCTPEAVDPLLERQIPGILETIRSISREKMPTAVLSRGVCGVIGDAMVLTLPGSPGGVRDGLSVLLPVLTHLLDQLSGGDHRAGGGV